MFHPGDAVNNNINKEQFTHLSMWFDVIFLILNVSLVPMLKWKNSMSDRMLSTLCKCVIFSANSDHLFIYVDISPLTKIHLVFQDKWKGFRGVNLET